MSHKQTSNYKIQLLTLFIAGTTLFSCQNKEDKKQEIEKAQIAIDTSKKEPIAVEKIPSDKNEKTQTVNTSPQPSKADQVQLEKNQLTIFQNLKK
ncbi:hypothetical protein ACQ9BO_05500 [Flavobacterium sp. P21]|uniref:hypothetical protein n=1 Tax=Flavobacterium sp. P21 TaxID=3423948 RepID=UPI003D66C4A8